jgi:hypothetical protein
MILRAKVQLFFEICKNFGENVPIWFPKIAFFFAKREIEKQKHRQVGTLHVVWSGVN